MMSKAARRATLRPTPDPLHVMKYQGGNTSKCLRCGTFINHTINLSTLPARCNPTPQWLREHPDEKVGD